jgi:hypothetical protein
LPLASTVNLDCKRNAGSGLFAEQLSLHERPTITVLRVLSARPLRRLVVEQGPRD